MCKGVLNLLNALTDADSDTAVELLFEILRRGQVIRMCMGFADSSDKG